MNLKQALEDILFSENDYYLISRGINSLYEKYSETTQIYAAGLTEEHLVITPNGGVVTPVCAAHCLKDMARTTHFMRGIYRAINHFLSHNPSVHILYAGCGPYATLLTPFTALYGPDKLRFTFLEIEKISWDAVNKLYKEWGIAPYLDEVRLVDATDPFISFSEPFDIIISETMQLALKNECQVTITRNLVRFLKKNGTFIPQQIKLDVYLTIKKQDSQNPGSDEKLFIGTAYDFNYRNLPAPGAEILLTIPESDLEWLKLYTTIHLYEDEKLTAYQSSLTLPLILDRLVKKRERQTRFRYTEGKKPELHFEYVNN